MLLHSILPATGLLSLALLTTSCSGDGGDDGDDNSNGADTRPNEEADPEANGPQPSRASGSEVSAAGKEFPIGICRSDLAWEGGWGGFQQGILQAIRDAGAKRVRLTLHHDRQLATVTEQIRFCNSVGLEVCLVIILDTDALIHPGAARRGGGATSFDVFGLSSLNTGNYNGWVRNILGTLAANNAAPKIIQVGNEPNWADFNGDLPLVGGGRILAMGTPFSSLGQIASGAQKMGEAYRLTLSAARASLGNVPVVLGGLNKIPQNFAASAGLTHVHPEVWLRLMEGSYPGQTGATNYLPQIEAFAYHFYPLNGFAQPTTIRTRASEYLNDFMIPVLEVTGRTRPIYVTEMGYAQQNFSDDSQRGEVAALLIDTMAQDPLLFDLPWRNTYIYSWDDPPFMHSSNNQPLPAATFLFDTFRR